MNLLEQQSNEFFARHIGPHEADSNRMLKKIGVKSLEELISQTVPATIRMQEELDIPAAMSEHEYLRHIKDISLRNKVFSTYIGQGYYDTEKCF